MSLVAIDNARNSVFGGTRLSPSQSQPLFNLAELAEEGENNASASSRVSVVNFATQVAAQLYAQQTDVESEKKADTPSSAVDEFRKFLDKTPEERMISQILSSMGLTEEDLKAMSPDELAKVQKEIARRVEEKIEQATEISAKEPAVSAANA